MGTLEATGIRAPLRPLYLGIKAGWHWPWLGLNSRSFSVVYGECRNSPVVLEILKNTILLKGVSKRLQIDLYISNILSQPYIFNKNKDSKTSDNIEPNSDQ